LADLRTAQIIEHFHLAFLQVLAGRLPQASHVLKGGANLRYFFGSFRYSEGIDLDARGIEAWALTDRVDGVLGSAALTALLGAGGLAVSQATKPKQTDTTQRWRVEVTTRNRDQVRTKIEFSRRNGDQRYLLEAVPEQVVAPYALRPPTLQHYLADAAIEQKILALAGRSETQARDVFDLELLLRRHQLASGALAIDVRENAAERATSLPFSAFQDQVLPFLDAEVAELYDTPPAWDQAQTFVVSRLLEEQS